MCLFAERGYDLRSILRGGGDDVALSRTIAGIWQDRSDNYSERRGKQAEDPQAGSRRIEMSYIGG